VPQACVHIEPVRWWLEPLTPRVKYVLLQQATTAPSNLHHPMEGYKERVET